ncbi:MAG: hypothetical protein Q9220_006523 [cf. Caloplaca sp. 1 TL-2023]
MEVAELETGPSSTLQSKVGAENAVATYSAARSPNGWMGGMDNVKVLLTRIKNSFGRRIQQLKLDQNLQLLPCRAHILTSHGPVPVFIDGPEGAFGADIRTQVIGSTICALAHVCEPLTAAQLFCRFFLPYYFGESNPLADTLHGQLIEQAYLTQIVNEGAARGYTDRFIKTVASMKLPVMNQGWRSHKLSSETDEGLLGETNMIGGFLKYLTQDQSSHYFTRSSAVAFVAACLKSVGHLIGDIQTWDGHGMPPIAMNPKSLTLVLGGSFETDPLMEDLPQIPNTTLTLHYEYKTVGSMLMSALRYRLDILVETLQEDFESVYEYMEKNLHVKFVQRTEMSLPGAEFYWGKQSVKASSIALRLATIHFPICAESIAPCYARIANEHYLNMIRPNVRGQVKIGRSELARFRTITATIAISIASRLAPDSFKNVSHATVMELDDESWVSNICKVLDNHMGTGSQLQLQLAIVILASVHAAHEPIDIEKVNTKIVGWRNGIYGIVPDLLLTMAMDSPSMHLVCIDYFWANVRVREDGSIRSSQTPDLQTYDKDPIGKTMALQKPNEPGLGQAVRNTPDLPLHLSLGAPLYHGEPDLCFIGRIGGSVAGTVGILDVLRALLFSDAEPQTCPGHSYPKEVWNATTSAWAQHLFRKPISWLHPTFVPVEGDHCWAIFLAGQTATQYNGRTVFRCVDCAVENFAPAYRLTSGKERPGVYIGLFPRKARSDCVEMHPTGLMASPQ